MDEVLESYGIAHLGTFVEKTISKSENYLTFALIRSPLAIQQVRLNVRLCGMRCSHRSLTWQARCREVLCAIVAVSTCLPSASCSYSASAVPKIAANQSAQKFRVCVQLFDRFCREVSDLNFFHSWISPEVHKQSLSCEELFIACAVAKDMR